MPSHAEAIDELRPRAPDVYADESFKQGYARGRAYVRMGARRAA